MGFDKVIGIIGCGNMGSALLENLHKRLKPKGVVVLDQDKNKQTALVKGFGARAADSAGELVAQSDVVIIAVKPQDIQPVLEKMAAAEGKLVISIAAGITISLLQSFLGVRASIVRAMPNLNALIGESMTALAKNDNVSAQEADCARAIFDAAGQTVFVQEAQLNAVTAISGSGPAFVAYLKDNIGKDVLEETLRQEALRFGFSKAVAETLAKGTVEPTLKILRMNFDSSTLIKRVASKGGTTEAGLEVLKEKGKTPQALSQAVQAAFQRAQSLSRRV